MRPRAPPKPTRVSANACADHFDVYDEPGQENFEIALRFGLNPPRERPHIFLTALARVARWAGVYSRRLVALARNGAFTILTGAASPCTAISRCAPHHPVCYAQILILV